MTPLLKKTLVTPFMPLIPYAVPANIITLFSNIFVYLALITAVIYPGKPQWIFITTSCMLMLYVIGDHMDGMQAKRTQTSSPLGEFFDHFLDAFNNGLVLALLLILYDIPKPMMLYYLGASYLAHASVFFNQFKTGWLVFDKIGSLEAMILTIFLLALSSFSNFYGLLTTELYGYRLIDYLLMISSTLALGTFLKSLVGAGLISWRFLLFSALWSGLTMYTAVRDFSFFYAMALLIVYASFYIGSLMYGHLIDGREPLPDLIAPLLLLLFSTIQIDSPLNWLPLVWLILRCSFLGFLTFYTLRKYWVWTNPVLTD